MTTLNNFKSTTIRGLFKNSDYPDSSELASAIFDRDISVNNNIYCHHLISNDTSLNFVVNGFNSNFDVSGNFNCFHNVKLNNYLVSYAVDPSGIAFENLYYGNVFSNKGMVCVNGFYVKSNSGSSAITYALIDNAGNSQLSRLILSNVLRTSTTVTPSTFQDLGIINTINKGSFLTLTLTTALTTLYSLTVNNSPYAYGTYRFKLFFSGSGSASQTLSFCINNSSALQTNKTGKQTTNTNISTIQYDLTLNIYSSTTVYFLAQVNTGTYAITDAYIEMVRVA